MHKCRRIRSPWFDYFFSTIPLIRYTDFCLKPTLHPLTEWRPARKILRTGCMISDLMVSLHQRMTAVSHATTRKIDASGFVEQFWFWRKWLGFVRRKSFQTDPRAVPLLPIRILSTTKGAAIVRSHKFQRVTFNMIPAVYYLGHFHYRTDISFQNEECVLMQYMSKGVWSKSTRSSCAFS